MRRSLRLAAGAIALLAPTTAEAARPAPPLSRPPALTLVHAVRGNEARFEDSAGRQVIWHGVNVNQLGDYYAKNSHPPSAPLIPQDFVEMRKLGFNAVRLLMHWSLLEPAPGQFDEAYLERIRAAVAMAKAQGIYTMIDMHQDAWGKFIAARPGEPCVPPLQPNLGWDGAPEWATLDGGLPRCNLNNLREISAPVAQAFQSFWDNAAGPGGVGIQTRLLATWRRVAQAFAGEDAVLGYDLFNEPHPGVVASLNEGNTIVPYYRRAIGVIREVDRRHTIFVEPTVVRSAISDTTNMPFVSEDPNLAYAPHIYADRNGLSPDGTGRATEREWLNALNEALSAGGGAGGALPVWIGEFGALDPPARDDYNSEFMTLADRFAIGWAHWVWKDTCGDPHDGYGPFPDESFNNYDCASDTFTGLKRNRVLHYSRPYPLWAHGRIARISFDERSKRFELRGTSTRAATAPTVVSIPLALDYRGGSLRITAANLRQVRLYPCADGTGILTAMAGRGDWALILTRAAGGAAARVMPRARATRRRARPTTLCR